MAQNETCTNLAELPWMSDRAVAEAYTSTAHKKHNTKMHAPGGNRNCDFNNRATADPGSAKIKIKRIKFFSLFVFDLTDYALNS